MTEPQTQRFKIILLGDSDVGKTTLLHRYIHDSYSPSADITIPADFHHHSLETESGVRVKLQIVDTNGHEKFRGRIKGYIRSTDGFLLVFDVTNHRSFRSIKNQWFPLLRESAQCVLVGHKGEDKNRCVSRTEVERWTKELDMPYMEVSYSTGHNVKEAFETLVRQVYREKLKREETGASCSCVLM